LWKNLRCQKQKRKRYASGVRAEGKSPTMAIVTVVERKSGVCRY